MLDEMNPNIQFTKDISKEELQFLDVLVKKWNTRITTDIYYKVTDTHQYLHFDSCHPHQTKTSIPYNIVRRICTIVSEKDTRDIRLNELKIYLLKQKYPEQLIDNGIYKAKEHERSDLLLTRGHERNSNITPFVHTHNPRNQNVNCIINQLNTIIKEDQPTRGILWKWSFYFKYTTA